MYDLTIFTESVDCNTGDRSVDTLLWTKLSIDGCLKLISTVNEQSDKFILKVIIN